MSSSRDPSATSSGLPHLQPPYSLDQSLERLRALYARFQSRCQGCKTSIVSPDSGLAKQISLWRVDTRSGHPLEAATFSCQHCSTFTCIGCGQNPVASSPSGFVQHHCQQGRLFTIWNLLARFDEEETRLKAKTKPTTKPPPSNGVMKQGKMAKSSLPHVSLGSAKLKPKDTGVGYGGGGIGYEGIGQYDSDEDDYYLEDYNYISDLKDAMNPKGQQTFLPKITDQEKDQNSLDSLAMTTLQLLTPLLNDAKSNSTSQLLQAEPDELCLLRLSLLFDRVCDLMKNDSIEDMTKKEELYEAAFAFLQAISGNLRLSKMLFEERPGKKKSPGLRILSDERGRWTSLDLGSSLLISLFVCCKDTYNQARAFKAFADKAASQKRSTFRIQNKQSINVCERMIALYEKLQQDESSSNHIPVSDADSWKLYCSENRVTFTDEVLKSHRFSGEFSKKKAAARTSQIGTIAREIANMTTSLPDGIFLKVAEERSDVMKALIIGADGSPYAGGLFVFDIFLDASYPINPPKINFVLDEGQNAGFNVGFNPNLHLGGSVCLSLLNTWSGSPEQMWQPNKSTILSVLVSIQAMILGTPFPYCNEPGYETTNPSATNGPVMDYNRKIQCKTVWYAMIFWLEEKNLEKKTVWNEVSSTYWKYNGRQIVEQVREWTKQNMALLSYDPAQTTHHHPSVNIKGKGKEKSNEKDLIQLLEALVGEGEGGQDLQPAVLPGQPLICKVKGKGKTKAKAKANDDDKLQTKTSSSKKRKAGISSSSSAKRSKNQKPVWISDDEDDGNEDYNPRPSKRPRSATTSKIANSSSYSSASASTVKATAAASTTTSNSGMPKKWIYAGEWTQKEVRKACKEFGVGAARSIDDSIKRLQTFVNDNKQISDSELGGKWGGYESGTWF